MTPDPVNDPVFQSPGSTSSEAQRALEMEARLPLTGSRRYPRGWSMA
jgi:hypothetical protein